MVMPRSLRPANEHELPGEVLTSHGHEDAADGHALAETHHHARLGQTTSQLRQQTVEALFARVTPDLIRVRDADPFFQRHLLKRRHPAFTVVTWRGTV